MIRKCPMINSIITTSTTSPKPGLASNGAAGGLLVVAFSEKLDAEVKSADAGDIATILKTSQAVWASRVVSSSRAVQFVWKMPTEDNNSLWGLTSLSRAGTKRDVRFRNEYGQGKLYSISYQVNDKSLRNKRNMFAFYAAFDATVVCIVKMSREKSFNAATDLI